MVWPEMGLKGAERQQDVAVARARAMERPGKGIEQRLGSIPPWGLALGAIHPAVLREI